MYIFEEIEQLSHAELFDLIIEYDRYVTEILERNTSDKPVCVAEFYDNEYQLIIKREDDEKI